MQRHVNISTANIIDACGREKKRHKFRTINLCNGCRVRHIFECLLNTGIIVYMNFSMTLLNATTIGGIVMLIIVVCPDFFFHHIHIQFGPNAHTRSQTNIFIHNGCRVHLFDVHTHLYKIALFQSMYMLLFDSRFDLSMYGTIFDRCKVRNKSSFTSVHFRYIKQCDVCGVSVYDFFWRPFTKLSLVNVKYTTWIAKWEVNYRKQKERKKNCNRITYSYIVFDWIWSVDLVSRSVWFGLESNTCTRSIKEYDNDIYYHNEYAPDRGD